MHIFWGALIISAGLFLLICATLKSDLNIYQLLVARSRKKWKEKVYKSHQVAGILIINLGVLIVMKLF
jgi:SNF family Na+-dependent transporter